MTVSKDLFLSILSMDAYNRGYNPGIQGLSDDAGTMVGSAAIQDQDLPANYQAASFFAISYTIGSGVDGISPGTTVISYRGTDSIPAELVPVDLPISFLGSYQQEQISYALKFFQSVNETNGGAPMLLTGHSLGGGLAGITGAVNDTSFDVVDHIGFNTAVANLVAGWDELKPYYSADSFDQVKTDYINSNGGQITEEMQIYFEGRLEPLWIFFNESGFQGNENPDLEAITGFLQNSNSAQSFFLSGSVADLTRGSSQPISSPTLFTQLGDLTGHGVSFIQAHGIALNAIMKFAEQEQNQPGFMNFIPALTDGLLALHSNDVAEAAGFSEANTGGRYSASEKMMSAIAYSALEGDGLVFGDTAIRSYFNDL